MVSLNRRHLLKATVAAGSIFLTSVKAHARVSGDVQLRGQFCGEHTVLVEHGMEGAFGERDASHIVGSGV